MKLFLINDQGQIHLRDASGESVSFADAAEYLKYTGETLPYDGFVCYEPPNYYIKGVGGSNTPFADAGWYEAEIAKVATYQSRKADLYYGLSVEAAIATKVREIMAYCDAKDAQPFLYDGNYWKVTDAVLNTLNYCTVLGLEDTDPLPINGGKWDNYDASVSVSMTVGGLKLLYKAGYEVPAANYITMKQYVGSVMQLTSVISIRNYNFSEGWV